MRLPLLAVLLSLPAVAQTTAQATDAGVPAGEASAPSRPGAADGGVESQDQLEQELAKAIQGDQKANAANGQPAPAPAAQTAPAPASGRSSQSLNPDISAIVDADFGWQRRASGFQNGDEPDLKGQPGRHAVGAAVQEVELALSAIVDPYFKGEVYLTIPNLEGLEVEEAFATTTSLPYSLQVKAGSFRSAFGRQNGQHLHVQDFTRRPLMNAAFLGGDGLRGPAVQASWLAPLPFFLTLYGEVISIRATAPDNTGAIDRPDPVATFGADGSTRPTLALEAKAFFPFGDEWSVFAGLNFASGRSPGIFLGQGVVLGANRETQLFGGDLYVKWKPANVAQGYDSLAWQTEFVFRHFDAGGGLSPCGNGTSGCGEWDGGGYTQVVYQFSRRWFAGIRGELVGVPTSSVLARTSRLGASLTWQASEFARVRAYADWERADLASSSAVAPLGPLLPAQQPSDGPAAFLQLEISIGAHGAHPF